MDTIHVKESIIVDIGTVAQEAIKVLLYGHSAEIAEFRKAAGACQYLFARVWLFSN